MNVGKGQYISPKIYLQYYYTNYNTVAHQTNKSRKISNTLALYGKAQTKNMIDSIYLGLHYFCDKLTSSYIHLGNCICVP